MITAMNAAPPSPTPKSKKNAKADNELLQKGLLLVFIGLAVLIGPMFMAPSGMRDVVAASAAVGWFSAVLGGGFIVRYGQRRRAAARPSHAVTDL
jgi:hypothetical protein